MAVTAFRKLYWLGPSRERSCTATTLGIEERNLLVQSCAFGSIPDTDSSMMLVVAGSDSAPLVAVPEIRLIGFAICFHV